MLRYTATHEWLRIEGDVATIGLTRHAAGALGDIVAIGLPAPATTLARDAPAVVIESIKAAVEIPMPLEGRIVAVNPALSADPALAGRDPEGAGWLFQARLTTPGDAAFLLDPAAYRALTQG